LSVDKIYGGDEDLYLALVEQRLTDEQRVRLIFENHALHAPRRAFSNWRGEAEGIFLRAGAVVSLLSWTHLVPECAPSPGAGHVLRG